MIFAHADIAELFKARCDRERAHYPLSPIPARAVAEPEPEAERAPEELPPLLRRQAQ